jgi:hypothetical protein
MLEQPEYRKAIEVAERFADAAVDQEALRQEYDSAFALFGAFGGAMAEPPAGE